MNTAKKPQQARQWVKDNTEPQTIDEMLAERETRYGKFEDFALINASLLDVMMCSKRWEYLSPPQRIALEMIQHKVARILNGDPDYKDNWRDIAGYAQLECDILDAQA